MTDSGEVLEPFGVPDVFAEGIGNIEMLAGGNVRITLCASQRFAGRTEHIVVAKIVLPAEQIPECVAMVLRVTGMEKDFPAVKMN